MVVTILVLAIPLPAWAEELTVSNTDDAGGGTLRDAIEEANSSKGADYIRFADGLGRTVTLASALPAVTDLDGLTIDGGGDVTLSGNGTNRVFGVTGGAHLALKNLSVVEGNDNRGGAILNDGTLEIIASDLFDNDAYQGGSIYNYQDAVVTISRSTLTDNGASYGGGIYNYGGAVTIRESILSGNVITSDDVFSGDGGGIYNHNGTVTIIDSALSQNNTTSGGGGGVYNNSGTLEVAGSTFSENNASETGGAIANEGTVVIGNSTVFDNSARTGGGVTNYATMTITNSTISANSADRDGGSGIANYDGTVKLRGTILANNASGGNCASAAVTDGGYNIEDGDTCAFLRGNNSVSDTDPLLDPDGLQDNGGATKSIALQPQSPAVDLLKGDACSTIETDQRGADRPKGAACDAGALERWVPGLWVHAAPASHDYGYQMVGTNSPPYRFTVQNTGTEALKISKVGIADNDAGQFSGASDNCSGTMLAPANSCTVRVSFSPNTTGYKKATLVFDAKLAPDTRRK